MKNRSFEQLEKIFHRSPEKLAGYYNAIDVKLCSIVSFWDLNEEQQKDYDSEDSEEQFYFADENSDWNYSMERCMRTENGTFHGVVGVSNSCGYGIIMSDCGTMVLVFSV